MNMMAVNRGETVLKIIINKHDALWSYIGTAFMMGAGIIILPFVLRFLNEDELGMYYVFLSLSAIAGLFDIGFSPSIARNVAFAWSGADRLLCQGGVKTSLNEPNYILIKKLILTCKYLYAFLASVAIIVALTIGTFYISSISNDVVSGTTMIAWLIYAFAIFFNILFSYYSVYLRGVGAVSAVNRATIIAKCIQIILSIVLLVFDIGLIGIAIAYLVYGLTFRIISKRMFSKYHGIGNKLKSIPEKASSKEVIELVKCMWPNTWREGLVTASNYVLNQSTTIIASLYLSLSETGLYSLSIQLVSAIATIAATMYTAYQPSLQSAYTNRDFELQRKNMSIILLSFCLIFVIGMAFLLILGQPVILLLKPTYQLSIPVTLLLGVYQFMLKYRNCCCSYISSTNRLIYSGSFVVSAAICITLSLLFTDILGWGVYGLIAAQIISQAVYNVWRWPVLVHRELKLSPKYVVISGSAIIINMLRQKTVIEK